MFTWYPTHQLTRYSDFIGRTYIPYLGTTGCDIIHQVPLQVLDWRTDKDRQTNKQTDRLLTLSHRNHMRWTSKCDHKGTNLSNLMPAWTSLFHVPVARNNLHYWPLPCDTCLLKFHAACLSPCSEFNQRRRSHHSLSQRRRKQNYFSLKDKWCLLCPNYHVLFGVTTVKLRYSSLVPRPLPVFQGFIENLGVAWGWDRDVDHPVSPLSTLR